MKRIVSCSTELRMRPKTLAKRKIFLLRKRKVLHFISDKSCLASLKIQTKVKPNMYANI